MSFNPYSWHPGRFLKTLVYFDVLPFSRCIRHWIQPNSMDLSTSSASHNRSDGPILFDFTIMTPADLKAIWGSLDDVVMGGVSSSQIQLGDRAALFTGNVSTANSGGFASVRTRNFDPPWDLAEYQGLNLRVKGDGQRYKFLMRCDAGWDSLAYSYSFDTVVDQWIEVYVPFSELIPVFRARTVPGSQPFNAGRITSLQLMLSKFEYDGELNPYFRSGPFLLQIEAIAAARAATSS
jgi:hypothetical protein